MDRHWATGGGTARWPAPTVDRQRRLEGVSLDGQRRPWTGSGDSGGTPLDGQRPPWTGSGRLEGAHRSMASAHRGPEKGDSRGHTARAQPPSAGRGLRGHVSRSPRPSRSSASAGSGEGTLLARSRGSRSRGAGNLAWRGVAWRGVAWRGVAWRGVAWRGVAWRGVAWRGVTWRGVAWSGGRPASPSRAPRLGASRGPGSSVSQRLQGRRDATRRGRRDAVDETRSSWVLRGSEPRGAEAFDGPRPQEASRGLLSSEATRFSALRAKGRDRGATSASSGGVSVASHRAWAQNVKCCETISSGLEFSLGWGRCLTTVGTGTPAASSFSAMISSR